MEPLQELGYAQTPIGEVSLRLRRDPKVPGVDLYEIKLGDEFLMSSLFHAAEDALAVLGLAQYWIPKQEKLITKLENMCIREALLDGKNVVVDATNLNRPLMENRIINLKQEFVGLEVEVEFFEISVEDAIKCYTLNAAYASFEEKIKGSIEVGRLADFVVLSENILTIDPVKNKDVFVEMTVFDGEIVYTR